MDNQFATIEGTYHEKGILAIIPNLSNLIVIVSWQIVYDSEGYFPETVYLQAHSMAELTISAKAKSTHKEGKFEVGMVGVFHPRTFKPYPQEKFLLEIISIKDNGKYATAQVHRPLNIPIYPERWSIDNNSIAKGKKNLQSPPEVTSSLSMLSNDKYTLYSKLKYSAPWAGLMTLVGLSIPHDLELDENTWLIELIIADTVELEHYIEAKGRLLHNEMTHAICFKSLPGGSVKEASSKFLTALRLFKPGYLETGLDFTFQAEYLSYSLQDKPPYTDEYYNVQLSENELGDFQTWFSVYNSVSIDSDSLMAKALNRFERTYFIGEAYERITDSVIGLELLLTPIQVSGISYRVAQRLNFLLSDDPITRLSGIKRIKKAYAIRSNTVHSGKPDEKADEEFAVECQELLRSCIRKILEADAHFRNEFCQSRKSYNSINNFYEILINFGNFQAAINYWIESLEI